MNVREEIAGLRWFHSIDFGEFASTGRFTKGTPQNFTLYGVFEFLQAMELTNASLLDIGTYDGITAFGAKKLGARKVTAVDNSRQPTFMAARKALGYSETDVEHNNGTQIKDLVAKFGTKSFDCIVCAGVLYHMLNPMQAFTETRKTLKDGGFLMLETVFDPSVEEASIAFNPIQTVMNEIYTYFVPSRSALVGMANLAGFTLVAERVLDNQPRITLLLKSTSREALIQEMRIPDFLRKVIKQDTCDNEFRFKFIEKDAPSPADVELTRQLEPTRTIVVRDEHVTFPYHPPSDRPVEGIARFEEARKKKASTG